MRLIIGNGKVSQLIRRSGDAVLSRPNVDLRSKESIQKAVNEIRPTAVINCAAVTNLEYCQDNKVEAYETNTLGSNNLLEVCANAGIKLVHISSGCLFDGNQRITTESSLLTPRVWYTWTKAWADQYIENYGYENYLILRPRQLFCRLPYKSNIITKFASMREIRAIKEENSAVCIEDLGHMIDHLLNVNATGVFNCANEGTITPYDMAIGIRDRINPELRVSDISYEDFLKTIPNRRVNTIQAIDKLKSTGYIPRNVKDAFEDCLINYGK
jgi:dTDP-4-dehydrorhamnose reductase